jgi:3D (Asp-Asp-Asp) domain-containing protein
VKRHNALITALIIIAILTTAGNVWAHNIRADAQAEFATPPATEQPIVAPEPTKPAVTEAPTEQRTYLGEFTVYAYSLAHRCCGKYPGDKAYGITRSGTTATEGRTIAADWSIIPEGTTVYIESLGYRVVEDTGSGIRGHKIDLFIADYSACVKFGVQKLDVWIVKEGG